MLDMTKIMNRNREVPSVKTNMKIEVQVDVRNITIGPDKGVALAIVDNKIHVIQEALSDGKFQPSPDLIMDKDEFAAYVHALTKMAQDLGIVPKPEKRAYKKRDKKAGEGEVNSTPEGEASSPPVDADALASDAAKDEMHFKSAAETVAPGPTYDPFGIEAL